VHPLDILSFCKIDSQKSLRQLYEPVGNVFEKAKAFEIPLYLSQTVIKSQPKIEENPFAACNIFFANHSVEP
jgi:hypothetical protein